MPHRSVYLDNNATTPLHPEVKKALTEAMDVFGNPSSMHECGRHARRLVEEARASIAGFIGAIPEELVFVGSGSEANNTVLPTLVCPSAQCECESECVAGTDLVTTAIEHPCILETSKCMQDRGIKVSHMGVDAEGKVSLDEIEQAITPRTRLVSVMLANNEIGTLQDVKAIARMVHEKGALFHTDACQAVGKVPVNVRELDVDFLTLSAHKVYGPKGIGALYVKRGTPFCPLIHGGHQEKGRRAGTENSLGIVGFGKAIEMRAKEMATEIPYLREMKAALKEGLVENIPDIHFNGHQTDCLPGTLNVSFDGVEGEAILLYLDLEGIAVSTGSACASGTLDPSHVLLATGMPVERAHGSIRMSLGRDNSMEDIEYTVDVVPRVINKLREMSTAYAGSVS